MHINGMTRFVWKVVIKRELCVCVRFFRVDIWIWCCQKATFPWQLVTNIVTWHLCQRHSWHVGRRLMLTVTSIMRHGAPDQLSVCRWVTHAVHFRFIVISVVIMCWIICAFAQQARSFGSLVVRASRRQTCGYISYCFGVCVCVCVCTVTDFSAEARR